MFPAGRVDRGRVPVRTLVDQVDRVVEGVDRNTLATGPKISSRATVISGRTSSRSSADEVTVVAGHRTDVRPRRLGAFSLSPVDEADDPIAVDRRNHGSHLHVSSRPYPTLSPLRRSRTSGEIRMDLADADDDDPRGTVRPRNRSTRQQVRDDLVELRIGHDDEDVLGAPTGLDPLPRSRRFA